MLFLEGRFDSLQLFFFGYLEGWDKRHSMISLIFAAQFEDLVCGSWGRVGLVGGELLV